MTTIRRVTVAQAPLLLNISRKTFIDAFAQSNDPADFNSYLERAFTIEQITTELNDPDAEFYFAYLNSTLAGYIKLNYNRSQTEYQGPDAVELERIYVVTEFQNMKIGLQLLQFTQAIAIQKQLKQIWLGVWEHNLHAIRFYECHGFIKFGSHAFVLGNDKQTDLLLKKSVT